MSKPKNQSAAAQAFDRSTVREVLNSQKTVEKEIALRAALAVMEEADNRERIAERCCPHCCQYLYYSGNGLILGHLKACPRVSAIRLVREALGE